MASDNDASADVAAGQQLDRSQILKLATEFGPLIVFFVANAVADIYWATAAFMASITVALLVSKIALGRVATMPLISGVFVIVFGSLTLFLQDDHFIKLKPTILNGLFAAILLGGLAFDKLYLRLVLGDLIQISETGWRKLTFRWAFFFMFLAVLNEIIWRHFSTDTWVAFKVFGIMPVTFAFALAQTGLLKKYELTEASGSK